MKTFLTIAILLFFGAMLNYCLTPLAPGQKNIVLKKDHRKTGIKSVGKCDLDTSVILENGNLPSLIANLEKADLKTCKTVNGIPPFIINFLDCCIDSGDFSIANPGENWQVTDVIMEKLPARQLVSFEIGDSIALMMHYTGGLGVSEHILIFRFHDNTISDFWCGNIMQNLSGKQDVITYIKANKDKNWGLNTNMIYF
jgi:hypothetical protein